MERDEQAYALFRQALVHGDPHAWRELYARYEKLVAAWVRRHPSFLQTGEPVGYFVNRAFDRLYSAVDADKFARFPDLDVARQQERRAFEEPVRVSEAPDPEAEAVANLEREELWSVVQSVVRDERERVLVYEAFVLGNTPQQLCRRRPDLFPSAQEVYAARRQLLYRLRRHPRVQALAAPD
jgi:hypothetical protein